MSVLKTVTGKRPKLIGTDLDGTIVAHYGFISERTKIAFTAGFFILTTTALNEYITNIKDKATNTVKDIITKYKN